MLRRLVRRTVPKNKLKSARPCHARYPPRCTVSPNSFLKISKIVCPADFHAYTGRTLLQYAARARGHCTCMVLLR